MYMYSWIGNDAFLTIFQLSSAPTLIRITIHWTGLDQLLSQNRKHDLTILYQLLSRVRDGLKELNTAFAAYIKVSTFVNWKLIVVPTTEMNCVLYMYVHYY